MLNPADVACVLWYLGAAVGDHTDRSGSQDGSLPATHHHHLDTNNNNNFPHFIHLYTTNFTFTYTTNFIYNTWTYVRSFSFDHRRRL